MAVTQNSYVGNGSTTTYSFTFPYLKTADVKAQIDATDTTAFTLPTATTLQFNTAPSNGAKIKIYRATDDDSLTATFYAGSSIKSEDLNDNFTQNLYTTQEVNARYLSNLGGTMVGDLTMDEDADIVFEGATADAYETTLTVADPTADRTITLPNVTGTVITTGDTGTVTATILAANSVDSSELVDGSIDTSHIADSQVTTAKLAADAVTGAKIADDTINSEHYVDGSIDTAHIADSQITTAKIANDAITAAKIAADAVGSSEIATNAVGASELADNAVDTAAIADNAVTNAKMADDSVGSAELVDGSVVTAALASNAVTLAKMADSSVGTAEIVADAITDAKISDNAVKTEHITNSHVTTAKINNDAVTQDKLADDSVGTPQLIDGSVNADRLASNAVTTAKIADDAVTSAKIAANAVTTTEIADAELTTLAGMQSGTASILAGGTALTATLTEINTVVDGKGVHTTISDSDAHYPTSGAVVDYVAAQIAPIGGLEVIADEDNFPSTQPASGVVISIADAAGIVVNGSGVSTTARTAGNGSDNVTINGFPSSLYSETLATGNGLMVTSTGSSNTYNYHKLLASESDVKQLSDDINDFNSRYRINAGEPSSNNDDGDLVWDTNADKMKVYDGTASAWKEVTSSGDFKYLFLCPAGGSGAPTLNGSIATYDLREGSNSGNAASVTSAAQLIVSIDGVIQKANTGTSAPAEGFALVDSNTIIFGANLASGSSIFIVQVGSAITLSVPADNTVATAKIQNLAVTTDKIAADAINGGKIANDAVGHEHIEELTGAVDFADNAKIRMGNGDDLQIYHDGSHSFIRDAGTGMLSIDGNQINFHNAAGSETMLSAIQDGAVSLYYDNSKKFETTSTGTTTTGTVQTDGDVKFTVSGNASGRHKFIGGQGANLELGTYSSSNSSRDVHLEIDSAGDLFVDDNQKFYFGTGDDLKIYHSGSHSYITNSGTGRLYINAEQINLHNKAVDENMLRAVQNAEVELYYDGTKKFETWSGGVTATGGVYSNETSGTSFKAEDGGKFVAGSGNDLEIYHNGNHSKIRDTGTGNLYIESVDGNIYLRVNDNEQGVTVVEDGTVELYHNNIKKLSTLSNGIEVLGSEGEDGVIYISADEGDDNADKWKLGADSTGYWFLENYTSGSWETNIKATGNGAVELYYDNSGPKLATTATGVALGGGNCTFNDSGKISLGTGEDLQIYHDGSHSKLVNSTGDLHLASNNAVKILGGSDLSEVQAVFNDNGSCELYYDNSKKFETTTNGATVTGHISGAHGVMEQFFTVCDGSTIALASGNKTVENVTADMDLTSTFADIPGSTLAYTPPTGAKQVIFEFHYYGTFKDPNVIWHHKLFLDSDEVTMARGTFRANEAFTDRIVMKWAFNIGGTAATASGRVASWTSDKTIKMQAREFGSSSEGYLHRLANWDGSTTDVEAPDAAMPCIGITAIG